MCEIKIVTFNIRTLYDDPYDGVNAFIHRAGLILETIGREQPHVICFQEVSDGIREFLCNYLPDYILVGHGRLEDYQGEGLSIAYRKDCMELFVLEHFWLSPTPSVPASRYENQSQYPRICQYAVLKHRDMKKPLRIYNVHLDHISDEARILGVRQILHKAAADNSVISYSTVIMGDFNAQPDSETVAYCKANTAYPLQELTALLGETFHDFGGTGKSESARGGHIDYMFADTETAKKTKSICKWEDNKNGIYLSDHYPIACVLDLE